MPAPTASSCLRAVAALGWIAPAIVSADLNGQATPFRAEKTAHFEIFYRAGSRAGAGVDRVAVLAERELARICAQLGIAVRGKFNLYLYDDLEDLSKTTGVKGTGGFSAGDASHVPYDNDQTRYHEMVHIVAHNLLPKSGKETRNLFFAEGLANACLEFVHGVPVHAVARHYRSQGVLPALQEMTGPLDFYAWLRARAGFNAYDVAGSYMKFLLDSYGAAKTTRYYTGTSSTSAFGVTEARLEKLWHAALDRFEMRPELTKLLDDRHKQSIAQLRNRQRPAGLPNEILGQPREWHSLMKETLVHGDDATWSRKDSKITGGNKTSGSSTITGSSKTAAWTICELGKTRYGDCIVRATIRTEHPTPIQLRLGVGNQAMLVNGTFLYRNDQPVASSSVATMDANRKTTDFVLVRRKGKVEIWIDGRLALSTSADNTPTPVGIAFHGGRAEFENVRVRVLN